MPAPLSKCPNCGSRQIAGDRIEFDGDEEIWQTIRCEICGYTWNEVYKFDHVEDADGNTIEKENK